METGLADMLEQAIDLVRSGPGGIFPCKIAGSGYEERYYDKDPGKMSANIIANLDIEKCLEDLK